MTIRGGIGQTSEKSGAVAPLLKFIAVGTVTGLGFGLVMAIVSNGFVLGVRALSSLREGRLFDLLKFGDLPVSFAPVVSLLIAVAAILLVRRVFGIKRWHGPADARISREKLRRRSDSYSFSSRNLRGRKAGKGT